MAITFPVERLEFDAVLLCDGDEAGALEDIEMEFESVSVAAEVAATFKLASGGVVICNDVADVGVIVAEVALTVGYEVPPEYIACVWGGG
jgi:hypothetical protein